MNTKDIEKIIEHLTKYKEQTLNINECGNYWKDQEQYYHHILPIKLADKNIINKGCDLSELLHTIKKHQGFHHLNSSQALALNLFGPLVKCKRFDIIDNINPLSNSHFEYIEDKIEKTTFDFFIEDSCSANKYFFEVKYTEHDFGYTDNDQKHQIKYEQIYRGKLQKISAKVSKEDFFEQYQLWRNIIYAEKGNVYFILPKFRTDLVEKIENAKTLIADNDIKNRINILYIDDIVKRAKNVPELKEHYEEFEKKYLVINLD